MCRIQTVFIEIEKIIAQKQIFIWLVLNLKNEESIIKVRPIRKKDVKQTSIARQLLGKYYFGNCSSYSGT